MSVETESCLWDDTLHALVNCALNLTDAQRAALRPGNCERIPYLDAPRQHVYDRAKAELQDWFTPDAWDAVAQAILATLYRQSISRAHYMSLMQGWLDVLGG